MFGERRKSILFKYVYMHVGDSMGDLFVCTGIIRHIASFTEILVLDTRDNLKETMSCLFSEQPNILPLTTKEYEEFKVGKEGIVNITAPMLSEMPLKYEEEEHCRMVVAAWERQHYENFDLPFSKRYSDFKLPKNIPGSYELYQKMTGGEKDYIVVNRYLRGDFIYTNYIVDHFNPNNYKVVEITPGITNNVLQFVDLFRNAKQIHVVPTSIHQLVDGMTDEIKGELFFHNIRKNFFSPVNCKWNEHRWKIVNYKNKY